MLADQQKFCAHMARVYLSEAMRRRKTGYRHQSEFRHWLIFVAGKSRLEYFQHIKDSFKPKTEKQLSLF